MFLPDKKGSSTWDNKRCNGVDNRIFVFIFISNMIRGWMINFGVDIGDVFLVDKIVYKIEDICFKFLAK